ncbi:hypothetical protein Hdeb2414_s0020g00561721 [Helianthus debilis subsp. tardiflorus]
MMADDFGGTTDSRRPMAVLRWRTTLCGKVVRQDGHGGVLRWCCGRCSAVRIFVAVSGGVTEQTKQSRTMGV